MQGTAEEPSLVFSVCIVSLLGLMRKVHSVLLPQRASCGIPHKQILAVKGTSIHTAEGPSVSFSISGSGWL